MWHTMKPGYTLLELLIAITIFSALIIMSVGIFARTVTSAAKSNVSRQKTEAARSIIDQISSDFRYVVDSQVPTDCAAQQSQLQPVGQKSWYGYCVDSVNDVLYMLIKYPGDATYTAKAYSVDVDGLIANGNQLIKVAEKRDCPDITCTTAGVLPTTMLNNAYYLDAGQVFSAIPNSLDYTNPVNPTAVLQKGSLAVNLSIKPIDLNKPCSDSSVAAGTCYQLSATLVPGGLQ